MKSVITSGNYRIEVEGSVQEISDFSKQMMNVDTPNRRNIVPVAKHGGKGDPWSSRDVRIATDILIDFDQKGKVHGARQKIFNELKKRGDRARTLGALTEFIRHARHYIRQDIDDNLVEGWTFRALERAGVTRGDVRSNKTHSALVRSNQVVETPTTSLLEA